MIRGQYALLFIAAVLSLWFGGDKQVYAAYAFTIAVSAVLLLYMSIVKPERDWYGARALAESIKTSTWRYMMKAEPFVDAPSIKTVRTTFRQFLKEILDANSHVRETVSKRPMNGDQITRTMDDVRRKPFVDRKAFYLRYRIQDQRNWYLGKAATNRKWFKIWIGLCIAIQLTLVALAIVRIYNDQLFSLWPMDPLMVLASALVGWVQIKKFNELASAYGLTAHEIGLIETSLNDVDDEIEFSEFVNEAERAFSREHTQWVARQNA